MAAVGDGAGFLGDAGDVGSAGDAGDAGDAEDAAGACAGGGFRGVSQGAPIPAHPSHSRPHPHWTFCTDLAARGTAGVELPHP